MPERPTIHLTNWSSKTQHGPGRKLCAMAKPRQWEHGDGLVVAAAPDRLCLEAVTARRMSIAEYKCSCDDRFSIGLLMGGLSPGALRIFATKDPVRDGDTLLCACARPDSPKRTHPCHLEWLAPYLHRAGWRVILYGVEYAP